MVEKPGVGGYPLQCKTADSFSGHNIISIGFLPRMHGLSLVRKRYRTDPRWATLQNERPVLFPRKVLNKRGKLKELVQIKRVCRDLTARCNIWHWIVILDKKEKCHHWDSWQKVSGVCGWNNNVWKWLEELDDGRVGACPCFGEIHTGIIRGNAVAHLQIVLEWFRK